MNEMEEQYSEETFDGWFFLRIFFYDLQYWTELIDPLFTIIVWLANDIIVWFIQVHFYIIPIDYLAQQIVFMRIKYYYFYRDKYY